MTNSTLVWWWLQFNKAVPQRLPDVALGENSGTIEGWIVWSLLGSGKDVVHGKAIGRPSNNRIGDGIRDYAADHAEEIAASGAGSWRI